MTVDPLDSSMDPSVEGEPRNRTALHEDVAVAVALLLVGVVALIWTVVQGMPFQVALFPRIAAAGLVLFSLGLAGRAALALRRGSTVDDDLRGVGAPIPDSKAPATLSAVGAWGLVIGTALFVLALPTLGFVISTVLGMTFGMLALGYRKPTRVALIAAGFTAGAYWLFFRLLNVPDLPPRLPWQ